MAAGSMVARSHRGRTNAVAITVAVVLSVAVLTLSAWPPPRPEVLGDALAAGSALLALVVVRLAWRQPRKVELVLGPAVVALLFALFSASGGLRASPLYPMLFVLVAFLAGLVSPASAALSGATAALTELLAHLAGGPVALPVRVLVAHVGFMALFGALFAFLLHAEARRMRRQARAAVEEAMARVEQDARDYRLVGSSLGPESTFTQDIEEAGKRRQVGSVRAIRESLIDVLEVARLAARADTAMLFVLDEKGATLKLKECVAGGGAPWVVQQPIPALEGALGAVVKTGRAVNLCPKDGGKHLGYRSRASVGSFLAVPVVDQGRLTGVLAVDRRASANFGAPDEDLLGAVAREAQRAIESERIFVAMDRVKHEQDRLYEAFALLSDALTIDVFSDRLLEATGRVKKVDFSCVTLFDAVREEHSIVALRTRAEGTGAAGESRVARDAAVDGTLVVGATFSHREPGLVAMALKTGHALPYLPLSEHPEPRALELFGRLGGPELASVKVFPLLEHGRPLGALVMGSTAAGRELSTEEARTIEVVCSHAAITLANAQMYKKMETMATTDGLTGLVNHRRFKELLAEAIARATRFSRRISVLMVDADHFKAINDTYGHPVGDLVLKRIAGLLAAEARRTDVVARYGGEEFVIVLDETDRSGAEMVGERIRARIAREAIQGDFGRVHVTISVGIATWPEHADTVEALVDRADQALYEAKKKGRNRVMVWRGAHCASQDRPAIGLEDGARESSPPQVRN